MGGPLAWHAHPGAWAVVAAGALGYAVAVLRLEPPAYARGSSARRVEPWRVACFAAGLAALGASSVWPLADLARTWSASAHVGQQVLLVLAAPPLLLLGLPRWLVDRATKWRAADWVARTVTHPVTAFVAFNAAVVAAWTPVVVQLEARSTLADAGVRVLLLAAGVVLWLPALRVLPGGRPLTVAQRIGYLFAQSIVFNFPALILIFAHHPLYPVYAAHVRVLGMSPVADQQVAGALAKVLGFGVLLGAVALVLTRAQRAEQAGADPDPLRWDEVEHELRRLDRRSHPPG